TPEKSTKPSPVGLNNKKNTPIPPHASGILQGALFYSCIICKITCKAYNRQKAQNTKNRQIAWYLL
ncbi:MAG: hypothetical protein ACKO43_00950, partial [Alphaproteobacteria bacterium]